MGNTRKRALPEQYRLARNLARGYEIRTDCKVHDVQHWLPVVDTLHVLSPLTFLSITVDPAGFDCLDGDQFTVHPSDDVYSRRPAEQGA